MADLWRGTVALLLLSIAAPAAALAEEDELLKPFRKCADIGDAAGRLACFDAALKESEGQLSSRKVTRARRAREDFGLSATQVAEREAAAPSQSAASVEDSQREPISIKSTLVEKFTDGNGKAVFLLQNGQTWREIPGSTYGGIIRSGWPLEIRRTRLGGYRLQFDGKTGFFSVRRLR